MTFRVSQSSWINFSIPSQEMRHIDVLGGGGWGERVGDRKIVGDPVRHENDKM